MENGIILFDNKSQQVKQVIDNTTLFSQYIASLFLRNKKEGTVKRYKNNLKQYFTFLNDNGLNASEANEVTIRAYAETIKELSDHTKKNYISQVKRFYDWHSNEYNKKNPAKQIDIQRIKVKFTKQIISPDSAKRMMKAMYDRIENSEGKSKEIALRDMAVFQIMIKTGLRKVSIEKLNLSSYSKSTGTPTLIYTNKGGAEENSYLSEGCAIHLDRYLETRTDLDRNAPMFISYSNRSLGERLGGQTFWSVIRNLFLITGTIPAHERETLKYRITPHSLRHTFGTYNYLEKGEEHTQGELGHTSSDMTRGYAKFAVELKRKQSDRSFLDELFDT